MCSWSGDLGVGDIHLPPSPPHHVPPSMLCPVASYRVHRTDIHLLSRGEKPPPSSSCPLLKFNFTLHPSPTIGPFSFQVSFRGRSGAHKTPSSIFLGPSQRNARERERSRGKKDGRGARARQRERDREEEGRATKRAEPKKTQT